MGQLFFTVLIETLAQRTGNLPAIAVPVMVMLGCRHRHAGSRAQAFGCQAASHCSVTGRLWSHAIVGPAQDMPDNLAGRGF